MTGIRRPNRRPVPELLEAATGERCPSSGKLRYVTRRHAEVVRQELSKRDPEAAMLEVYRHAACGDWHVGHNRRDVPRGKAAPDA